MTRILIAAAAAMFATAASAYNPDAIGEGAPTVRVSYGDLDLHSPAGRARLTGRIHSAAESLCTDANTDPLAVKLQKIECYRVAVASGTAQLNALAGR